MEFEWNNQKSASNLQKHGIQFAEATSVFKDDNALTVFDAHPDEDRYITIAMNDTGKILVVVYTLRGNKVRIISARVANKQEKQQYRSQYI